MNALLFFFAGGQAFWWGALFVGVAVAAAAVFPRIAGLGRIALELLLVAGAGLIWMAGPPLPGWFYFLWIVSVLSFIILVQPRFAVRRWPLAASQAVLVLLAAIFVVRELPYVRSPQLPGVAGRNIVVIGDSLSAGIGAGETLWPDLLAADPGWRIRSLAIPGARLSDARTRQAPQLTEEDNLAILMIGGNDFVRRVSPAVFAAELEALLTDVVAPGREVVLVELPFIPGYRAYGRIQRDAANRHDAVLIPRRYLARVLAGPESTLDGLHLSDDGHREWAGMLREFGGE